MSKRNNRAKSQAVRILKKRLIVGQGLVQMLQDDKRKLSRELASLKEWANSMRPFEVRFNTERPRAFRDLYTIQVSFSADEIDYTLKRNSDDVIDLNRHIHSVCDTLGRKIERFLLDKLTEGNLTKKA